MVFDPDPDFDDVYLIPFKEKKTPQSVLTAAF